MLSAKTLRQNFLYIIFLEKTVRKSKKRALLIVSGGLSQSARGISDEAGSDLECGETLIWPRDKNSLRDTITQFLEKKKRNCQLFRGINEYGQTGTFSLLISL